MEEKRSLPDHSAHGHAREEALGVRIVEAACATCIYDMQGVKGCKLAVKIDGKAYLVTGTEIDDHGDAHGPAGLCVTARKAVVTGKVEGEKFVATSFELQP